MGYHSWNSDISSRTTVCIQTNNHGGWFTWETAAAASEESEPCEGDGAVGCDDGRASVPVPPPPWVELDFGEVVTVGELDFRPPTKSFRGEKKRKKNTRD